MFSKTICATIAGLILLGSTLASTSIPRAKRETAVHVGVDRSTQSATDFGAVVRGVRPRGFGTGAYTLVQPPTGSVAYYVATTGNDANPGTSSLPFRTINKAAQAAVAGDVITIRDGKYSESVTVEWGGTATRRIVFQAENRAGVVLTGIEHIFKARGWFGGKIDGQPYVTLRGLVFFRYGALTNDKEQGGGVRVSKGWTIEDCLFDEPGHVGLSIRSDSVTVTRSTFRNAYLHAFVAWGPANGAAGPSDSINVGISALRLTDLLIYGNRTSAESQRASHASSVNKVMGTRGAIVDNVESYGNRGPGLWLDTRNFGYVIRNSYFHDNISNPDMSPGRGLHLELNWGPGLVERNVFANNHAEGLAINNSSGAEVRFNLFVGNGECIRISDFVHRGKAYATKNISIHHNQFKDWAKYGCISLYGDRPGGLNASTAISSSNLSIDHNIYDPERSNTLSGWWSDKGFLDTIDKLRALGLEANGKISKIRWPYP